jgi:hypothetical protein
VRLSPEGDASRLWRSAFLAFCGSRGLILALLIFGSQLTFFGKGYGAVWDTEVVFKAGRVGPELARVAMAGDSWWYWSVAERGYDAGPRPAKDANWGFFPLFPLAVRFLRITGNFALDGVLLSNAAFLGSLLLLGAVSIRSGLTPEEAERAQWYAAFFPTSYFLSLPLTESLFLLLSLAAFWCVLTARLPAAGGLGALAAATRIQGILLLPVLLILAFEKRLSRLQMLWLALVPAGTAAFFLFLRWRTGDLLAYFHSQANWGHSAAWFGQPLWQFIRSPAHLSEPWNFRALHFLCALLLIAAGVALLRRREFGYAAYALLSVLLPLGAGTLTSMARYAVVVFPLYFVLARAGARPAVDRTIIGTGALLLGWLLALLILRVDFAMA